jgi:hypothetical protein
MSAQSRRKSWRKRVERRYPWMTGGLRWVNGFLCDRNGAPLVLVRNQPPRILKRG